MSLIVQNLVAQVLRMSGKSRPRLKATRQQQGHRVVMVVAMGKNTDALLGLAATQTAASQKMDMLLSTGEQVSVALVAMAIHSLGVKANSLTVVDQE